MKKGISLIVLVITVIVLAILASVIIINMSDTNLIDESDEAVNLYNQKQYEEALTLAYADWLIANPGEEFTAENISELNFTAPTGYTVTVVNKVPVLTVAE